MKTIDSLQNPLVKHFVSLRSESSYRKEKGRVILIGEKIVREYPFPIRSLISQERIDIPAETKYLARPEILQKISGLRNFDSIVAEVDLPSPQNLEDKQKLLILDQIQNPGNLGTLLRTALALGWEGVIATIGTVDFFNDKALRASQGSIFRLPYAIKSEEQIIEWAQRKKVSLWIADAGGKSLEEISFQPPFALVLSHEGQGIGIWTKTIGKTVSIPLQNNVESLNVATAGAILLYQMRSS